MSKEHPIFMLLSPVVGNWRKALKLVEDGLDVSMCDEQGQPLISYAARSGLWDLFEAMVKQGATFVARRSGRAATAWKRTEPTI